MYLAAKLNMFFKKLLFCIAGLALTSCIGSWRDEKHCQHIVTSLECDSKKSLYRSTTDLVIIKKRVRNFDPFCIRTTLGPVVKYNEECYIAKPEDANYVISNTNGEVEEIYKLGKGAHAEFLDLSMRFIQDTFFWTDQGTRIYVVLNMKLTLAINGQMETIYPMLIIDKRDSVNEYIDTIAKEHYLTKIPYFKNVKTHESFNYRFSQEHFFELIRMKNWYFYQIQ